MFSVYLFHSRELKRIDLFLVFGFLVISFKYLTDGVIDEV